MNLNILNEDLKDIFNNEKVRKAYEARDGVSYSTEQPTLIQRTKNAIETFKNGNSAFEWGLRKLNQGYYNKLDPKDEKYKNNILKLIQNTIERAGNLIKNEIQMGKKFIEGIVKMLLDNKMLNGEEKANLFLDFIGRMKLYCRGNDIVFNNLITEKEIGEVETTFRNLK